uniref:Uncharacterized protein n=1 Tax=Panagrolaimus sp. PS1159 TaxID=55785 RepID=A0AC35G8X3_9BILA
MENNKDNVSNNPELMESLNAVNAAKAAGWDKHRHVQEHISQQ